MSYSAIILATVLLVALIRSATVLAVVQLGLGLYSSVFTLVTLTLALVLALLSLDLALAGKGGVAVLFKESQAEHLIELVEPILVAQTDKDVLADLQVELGQEVVAPQRQFHLRLAAYSLTQLRSACMLALKFLLPFLLIDLLVVHLVTLLSISAIGAQVISFPLKLLLLLALDGWQLIAYKLIGI